MLLGKSGSFCCPFLFGKAQIIPFMRKLVLSVFLILSISVMALAQTISRVEPPMWWIGMQNPQLQLMAYGKGISSATVSFVYPGVELVSVEKTDNPNYLFINLQILSSAAAGTMQLTFTLPNGAKVTHPYQLLQRKEGSAQRKGFDASDVVYLVFPDRFANGDTSNDYIKSMGDSLNRENLYARHGGDIQGIINNLDYIQQLGVTALWLNPVFENKQPAASYHGYAITDFYAVDPRLGSNALYTDFIDRAHQRGIKVIKDMIFNHCGDGHWWVKDLPSSDWVHAWPEFTRSNYRGAVVSDPNASEYDKRIMSDGWFDNSMPDLNQKNPFLATYLIQNSIWWVEYAGLDGIRMDTHPYPDKDFMASWAKAVMAEYPNFNIVSEVWLNYPAWCAYWQTGANNRDGYDSAVPTVMDFPLMYAMYEAFSEESGWDKGLMRLYEVLAHDFLYANPMNILTFPDNHDVTRFNRAEDKSLGRYKLAMAFLLTTRGIPQLYYGTEILMTGDKGEGDGVLRRDFPGGWPNDKRNAFTKEGRTKPEGEAWDYISNILNWRKTASAIHNGKLTHFLPENDIYVYFRYNKEQRVMVILNSGYTPRLLKTERFNELLNGYSKGKDIISGKNIDSLSKIQLSPRSAMIIELE